MRHLIALSVAIWLTACGPTDRARIEAAGARLGEVSAAAQIAADTRAALPDDCRRVQRAGVQPGQSLAAALLRYDAALSAANARLARCVAWWDEVTAL